MPDDKARQPAPAVRHLSVDENSAGQRLDNFLVRELKGVPKTRLYRALRKGEVRVNKGRVKADYRLAAGDVVRIPPLHHPAATAVAPVPRYWADQIGQRVVFENDSLLVINKPSGIAVHGGSGLSFGLIESLRQLRPDDRYLELVHRLDRDTSGLIMIARRPAMLRELHRQLREDEVDKRYLALVAGSWPRSLRVVEAPLEKNVLQSGERMVRVAFMFNPRCFSLTVTDEGPGFDWQQYHGGERHNYQVSTKPYGRGFMLIHHIIDEVYFNEKGNAITLVKSNDAEG